MSHSVEELQEIEFEVRCKECDKDLDVEIARNQHRRWVITVASCDCCQPEGGKG